MDVLGEGMPIAIGINTAELKESLSAFLDPTHASLIHASIHEGLDGTLDLPRADFEVLVAKFSIVHVREPSFDVVHDGGEFLAPKLVAWTRGGNSC